MNHQNNHQSEPPRHRQELPGETDAAQHFIGDARFIEHVAEQAPSIEAAARLREIFGRRGTAFAVFLALDDTARYSDTIEADFENAFIAHYSDRHKVVVDTIESFGWKTYLDKALGHDPLLRQFIAFNQDEVWAFVNDHFHVVDLEQDGIYVFERWQ